MFESVVIDFCNMQDIFKFTASIAYYDIQYEGCHTIALTEGLT